MKTYSRTLANRTRWLGLLAVGLLSLLAFWQYTPQSDNTIFTPGQRIQQVTAAGLALQAEAPAPGVSRPSAHLPCDGRSLKVLQASLMATQQQDIQTARHQIAQAADSSVWSDCPKFMQAFQTALRISRQGGFSPDLVKEALSEDVTWTRQVPCLLGGTPHQAILLGGNPLQCSLHANLAVIGTRPPSSSYRRQASQIAHAATMAAISGRWAANQAQWISLHPALHDRLDRWTACIEARSCPDMPELLHLRNAAIVVVDAQAGTVLASWCHGPACKRAQQQGPGVLPATLVESPPASTAKLLFAMAIASNGQVDPMLLQRQIKTSGQKESGASKRNEWWEKQAICADTPAHRCTLPIKTRQLAEAFGWNAHCTPGNPACGRWGLLEPTQPGLIPGQIGHLALGTMQEAGPIMMDWTQYDDIRQGKRQAGADRSYAPTSLAVQAAIGAGDSRISALGLAVIPMQIWRTSKGMAPITPSILQTSTSKAPVLPALGSEWRNAAQLVLSGMRKVIQPAEVGWPGPGTAMAAWMREMKKTCDDACGVWAKTGTVSQQDKHFGGTTTLAALVDTKEWALWRGQYTPESLKNRTLAIGVVAMPDRLAPKMHDASFIGMSAIRQLLLAGPP